MVGGLVMITGIDILQIFGIELHVLAQRVLILRLVILTRNRVHAGLLSDG